MPHRSVHPGVHRRRTPIRDTNSPHCNSRTQRTPAVGVDILKPYDLGKQYRSTVGACVGGHSVRSGWSRASVSHGLFEAARGRMILSRLAVEIFLSLAQDCHLTKSRSVQIRFIVSEGPRKSSNSVEANGTGAAGLPGSGIPESSRSGRITGRVMGPKGRASRRNVVSGSGYGATSDMVASRSSGGARGVGLFIAGVPRPMAP